MANFAPVPISFETNSKHFVTLYCI